MTIYFTSDLHHKHKNIIQYCNRPTTIEEHEDWLVSQLNSRITPQDTVYHLGDFSFSRDATEIAKFMNRLNGNWLHVLGNHDHPKTFRSALSLSKSHTELGNYLTLKMNGLYIVLMHYPIESWDRKYYGSIHLHGHVHNKENIMNNRFAVCIDNHEKFLPFTLSEVLDIIDNRNIVKQDFTLE